jgi:hypothetical protein
MLGMPIPNRDGWTDTVIKKLKFDKLSAFFIPLWKFFR